MEVEKCIERDGNTEQIFVSTEIIAKSCEAKIISRSNSQISFQLFPDELFNRTENLIQILNRY